MYWFSLYIINYLILHQQYIELSNIGGFKCCANILITHTPQEIKSFMFELYKVVIF